MIDLFTLDSHTVDFRRYKPVMLWVTDVTCHQVAVMSPWFVLVFLVAATESARLPYIVGGKSLQWCHNGHDSVSNHQPHDCLLNGLFRRRWKKTSKLRVTGLCEGNSPGTGEFPAQMASYAENVSIWRRHHVLVLWGLDISQSNITWYWIDIR